MADMVALKAAAARRVGSSPTTPTMPKHFICREEEFPVYDLGGEEGWVPSREVELPDGFVERYNAAKKEWDEIQKVMNDAWERSKEN